MIPTACRIGRFGSVSANGVYTRMNKGSTLRLSNRFFSAIVAWMDYDAAKDETMVLVLRPGHFLFVC